MRHAPPAAALRRLLSTYDSPAKPEQAHLSARAQVHATAGGNSSCDPNRTVGVMHFNEGSLATTRGLRRAGEGAERFSGEGAEGANWTLLRFGTSTTTFSLFVAHALDECDTCCHGPCTLRAKRSE